MNVTVVVPGVLRDDTGGRDELSVDVPVGSDVRAVLDALGPLAPGLGRRLRDETGALRRHVNVFVGADDVRGLGGLAALVPDGAVLLVLPSVAGG